MIFSPQKGIPSYSRKAMEDMATVGSHTHNRTQQAGVREQPPLEGGEGTRLPLCPWGQCLHVKRPAWDLQALTLAVTTLLVQGGIFQSGETRRTDRGKEN